MAMSQTWVSVEWLLQKIKTYSKFVSTKSQASTGGVLLKKVSLQILQNSQEIICTRASFL